MITGYTENDCGIMISTDFYLSVYQQIANCKKAVRYYTISQLVYGVKGDRLRRKRKPITTKRQIDKDRKTKFLRQKDKKTFFRS